MFFLFISHEIFTATIETDTITHFILQLKKLRLGKVKGLAQSQKLVSGRARIQIETVWLQS